MQLPITPAPGSLTPSFSLHRHALMCTSPHIVIYICTYLKINIFRKNKYEQISGKKLAKNSSGVKINACLILNTVSSGKVAKPRWCWLRILLGVGAFLPSRNHCSPD